MVFSNASNAIVFEIHTQAFSQIDQLECRWNKIFRGSAMNTQNINQLLYFYIFAVGFTGISMFNTSLAQTGSECRNALSNVSMAEGLHVPDSLTGRNSFVVFPDPNVSIDDSGLSVGPTTITHFQSTLMSDATYLTGNNFSQPWTFNFITSVHLSGAAIWIHCSRDYGGNDAPIKRFSLSSECPVISIARRLLSSAA